MRTRRFFFIIPSLLFLYVFIFPGIIFSMDDPRIRMQKLWQEFHTTKNDSLKIVKLSALASISIDYFDDRHLADSISELAIGIAERSYRPSLRLLSYLNYLEYNDLRRNQKKSLDYAQKAVSLSSISGNNETEWRSYRDLVMVNLAGYDFEQALTNSYKALSVASMAENEAQKAESYLCIGNSMEGKNQVIEAFRNYLNATSLAEKENKPALLRKCYSQLSAYYNFNKLYDKAMFYKLKEGDLIKAIKPVDSTALMWNTYDLQVIAINSNNNDLNDRSVQDIIDFAIRRHNERLKNGEFALYRTHLVKADQIGQLNDLYQKKYTGEFRKLARETPALYFRLKAFFEEYANRPDSALWYFRKAEERIQAEPNKISQSNFYNRFGQFLLRHGDKKEALEKFKKSFDLAREASYFEYMLTASRNMELIYSGLGDFRQAYEYLTLNKQLKDSMNHLSRKEDLVVMEINHEARQRELVAQREEERVIRRHNLQYTAIVIGIVAVFFILVMMGSFKVPEWMIKMLGFFSFILFFEFIVLLADQQIEKITHGEPWKVLLIKIVLIGFMLPFHEWLEKHVTEYLIQHKLIDLSKFPMRRKKTLKKRNSEIAKH